MSKWTSLDPSTLRHLITITAKSAVLDSFGQPVETWKQICETRADIRTLKQQEQYQDGKFTAEVTHVVTMRYRPEKIGNGMRVNYAGKAYQVQTIDNVEQRNIALKLMCLELDGTE